MAGYNRNIDSELASILRKRREKIEDSDDSDTDDEPTADKADKGGASYNRNPSPTFLRRRLENRLWDDHPPKVIRKSSEDSHDSSVEDLTSDEGDLSDAEDGSLLSGGSTSNESDESESSDDSDQTSSDEEDGPDCFNDESNDSNFNVIVLGITHGEIGERCNDITGMVKKLRLNGRQNGKAYVYLVDSSEDQPVASTTTINGIGEQITVTSVRIKKEIKPQLMDVAKQLDLVGKVDAALSDWSAPSFEFAPHSLGPQFKKVLRVGGVVYVRHVELPDHKYTPQYKEMKKQKLVLLGGGAYVHPHSTVEWFREMEGLQRKLSKCFELLEEDKKELPEQFILHHPTDDNPDYNEEHYQYIRIKKIAACK